MIYDQGARGELISSFYNPEDAGAKIISDVIRLGTSQDWDVPDDSDIKLEDEDLERVLTRFNVVYVGDGRFVNVWDAPARVEAQFRHRQTERLLRT